MRLISWAVLVLSAGGIFVSGTIAQAAVFTNEYLSLNIGDEWTCTASAGNWVCEPKNPQQKRVSIITISAKVAGPTDNLESFKSYLSNPRSHQMGSNMPVMSQVLKIEPKAINGWNWIQGLHLGSEIKDFYTIYYATVKNGLAVMLTFSAEKGSWSHYQPIFETIAASVTLKNYAPPIKNQNGEPQFRGDANGGDNYTTAGAGEPLPKGSKIPKIYIYGIGLALLILGVAVFIFLKGP